ncbi:hypothetical protein [Polyangium sp. 15x6]|uniref:hypothetical protein n=1 Tax=Polyangium sp. 15x6 TaxID=3042687 RepID=UPI00249AD29D|nr:hypothetical protein [Polyangium sp. 15x6]MDI3290311.1 hypothetical protein [Polyangium sp. 15x6]
MKTVWLFAVGAMFASVAVGASNAEALHKRESAMACFARGTTDSWTSSAGLSNYSTTDNLTINCAVNDDDRFKKEDVATLNMHGYNGNSSTPIYAVACVSYYASNGGACGASSSAAGVGNYTLSPARTYWTSTYASDFGFVQLTLGTISGSSASSFRGFYISN